MKFHPLVLGASLILLTAACGSGASPEPTSTPADLEASVSAVADEFGMAIATHDSTLAASVLAPGVTILEGGSIETRDQYLSHHFHSDAAFIGSLSREPISSEVSIRGDVAWRVSRSRLQGTYQDREIDMVSVETLILEKQDGSWKISSVHWSSGRG
ncbi:MAG: nuclear transport factor 2 family protein [Rhodothermales bacterium]|nr:nuclear transport factor 2 family protein [Rhodothermales bacterium]